MSYFGEPVKLARLKLENGILINIKLQLGKNKLPQRRLGAYIGDNSSFDDMLKYISLRYGEPKIDNSYQVSSFSNTLCSGDFCNSVPSDTVSTSREYTWRTSSIRIHLGREGFDIDLLTR